MIFSLFLFFTTSMFSLSDLPNDVKSKVETHSVVAQKGDGIISLLRRYKLNQYQCNVREFLEINTLDMNDHLIVGKMYLLPVSIFTYNGQSIRSTVGINDWDKAVRIKKYNETLTSIGIRKTHFTDSRILWVPHNELSCASIPTAGQAIATIAKKSKDAAKMAEIKTFSNQSTDPLFGARYKQFEVINNSLRNQVFYIISGHGGPDPGSMCKDYSTSMCEDEYAYDVALRVARNLRQYGAIVEMVIQDKNDGIRDDKFLVCDKDERCANGQKLPRKQLPRLNQRVAYINHKYKKHKAAGRIDQKVVSIHVDSNSKSHEQDVFFCYYKGSKASKKLANNIKTTFKQKYAEHQANRGYRGYLQTRNFYVLKNTIPPAVLIELANIKNSNDHKRILLHSNRQALAKWIFEGITKQGKESSNQVVASS